MSRKRRPVEPVVFSVLLLSLCSTLAAQCGVERWAVKTGTDVGASTVDLNSATPTTVSALIGASAPHPIPVDSRVQPTETTVWVLDATLTSFKVEGDSDYHLVISDVSGNTMIAEIPSPSCVGSGSPFNALIAQARAKFDAAFTVGTSFQDVNIPVQIKGVGMFDFLHGQRGVAPNGIELHPVLDIVLNPHADFSISALPTSLSVAAGATGNVMISTNPIGAFNSNLSLSASGNPAGINVSFASASISAAGSSNVGISVDPAFTPGTFVLTITASGGGLSRSVNVNLNVPAVSSPDFTVLASPSSIAVGLGGSNTVNLSVSLLSGFNADVSLSVAGLPLGLNATFTTNTIAAPGAGLSVLTVTAGPAAMLGTAVLTILASGGGTSHTATVGVSICGGPAVAALSGARSVPPDLPAHAMREGSEGPTPPTLRDEDDNQIQVLASEATLALARRHSGKEICRPLQYSIFLGRGWAQPANRRRESALAHLNAHVNAAALCASDGRTGMRAESREVTDDLSGTTSLSDMQIQARLASMLRSGALPAPKQETVYLVYLAPEIRSTLASAVGGQDYLAFQNHFHASQGEVRYLVVPFDSDSQRQVRTASRALLRALITPERGGE
jgi:hypothetical protein